MRVLKAMMMTERMTEAELEIHVRTESQIETIKGGVQVKVEGDTIKQGTVLGSDEWLLC